MTTCSPVTDALAEYQAATCALRTAQAQLRDAETERHEAEEAVEVARREQALCAALLLSLAEA